MQSELDKAVALNPLVSAADLLRKAQPLFEGGWTLGMVAFDSGSKWSMYFGSITPGYYATPEEAIQSALDYGDDW